MKPKFQNLIIILTIKADYCFVFKFYFISLIYSVEKVM